MKRSLLAAGLLVAMPALAFAQDKSVLNNRDDVDFAKALAANGYPELAERLLNVVDKAGNAGDQAKAQIAAIRLDVAQEAANKTEDPVKRKDALVKVLGEKEKFIEQFKGKDAAEDVRNALPELYNLIVDAVRDAMKKTQDSKALDALRIEGNAIMDKAEQAMKQRIADLKGIEEPTEADEAKLMAASYNLPHTIYVHSSLYPAGDAKRIDLCKQAMAQFDEFLLDHEGGENMLQYYAYIDYALCLKEVGSFDEANKTFDKTIGLRESWGPKNEKTGMWPIPAAAQDVVDIICYALLQKSIALREQKKFDEVVKLGDEYFKSIANPFGAPSSMLLLKETAEAMVKQGDLKGAGNLAKKAKEEDPNGYGNVIAQAILEQTGGAVGTPYTDKLATAQTKITNREYEKAIAAARQVFADTAGTPDEAEAGSSAWQIIGFAYQVRGWNEEAALAYETGVDRFPKAKGAPECLDRAIDTYTAASSRSRRSFLRDKIAALTERMRTEFASSPQAQGLLFKKGQQLAAEKDHKGAIEIFLKIEKTSTDYTRARLMIAIEYFNWHLDLNEAAKKLDEEKKAAEATAKRDEAKGKYTEAEAAFKEAIAAIQGHPQTMDQTVLKAYDEQEYLATLSLAKLYMLDGSGRAADATPVIDGLESKWGKDAKKGAEIQNLRGKWFLSQGKIDEAAKWVDDLVKRDARAAAGPAGQLAREVDRLGQEKFKAQKQSLEGDQLWLKAARYYWISVEPQVKGEVAVNVGEMTDIGNRLYVYGLHFNGVPEPASPEHRTTFVDWTPGAKRAPDAWQKAAKIYEVTLQQSPDYRMAINYGRTLGFLQQWADAARVYSDLFQQEQVVDQKAKNKLDRTAMSAKPELVMAYIELGTAERIASQGGSDKERSTRAMTVLTIAKNTLRPDVLPHEYWAANYQLARVLIDRGEYKNAQLSIEDITRNVSADYDGGKFGYKQRFLDTVEELKKK